MTMGRRFPPLQTPSPASPLGETAAPLGFGALWGLAFVGVTVALLCAPFLRVVFWTGDEGVMLNGARRLLLGERLYAEFFEAVPPGGLLFTAAWLGTVGLSFGSARLLALLTLVGIACFTYLACLGASRNLRLSAVLAIASIGIAVSEQSLSMMTINHHWFTTLFSMGAASAALAGASRPGPLWRWPLIAGIAAGMAAMVIPTCGSLAVLAGAVACTYRRDRVAMIAYGGGVLLIPFCLLAHIIATGRFSAAFDDVILFPFNRYSSIQGVPFGTWATFATLPLKYFYPLTALLAVVVAVRAWQSRRPDPVLPACGAFAIAGFIASYPRPDIFHIAFTAPLACPLFAHCADRLGRGMRPRYRVVVAVVALLLCLPAARAYRIAFKNAVHAETVATPSGDTRFVAQPGTPQMLARIAETPSSDRYFFYPYMPLMPFLAARPQVGPIDLFTPEFTMPSQYAETCVAVMREAAWVVIDRRWTDPHWLAIVFPSMRNARPEETVRFEHALESGFDLVGTDETFELRHRREDANEALCAGIAG